ncbi:MAG: hypothetical protein PHQ50_04615 [Eubacteriales bacterium]|nr:hypothetical protein [Eubacteriales bacterium]MDD3350200.1 hypothetical protein [Eubacteriales bacterium]
MNWILNTIMKKQNEVMRIEAEAQRRQEMRKILSTAERIIETTQEYGHTHPVYLLIKQLVDQELYKNIFKSISTHEPNMVKGFDIYDVLPEVDIDEKNSPRRTSFLYTDHFNREITYSMFVDDSLIEDKEIEIQLGFDAVLTCPWEANRLSRAYSYIGECKNWGEWTQDLHNHRAAIWMPLGLTFVHNGNHSITAGIMNNEGVLKISRVHDLSEVYQHIYCDGVNFFRKEDNSFYAPVENFNLAVVFEIGRIIDRHSFPDKLRYKNFEYGS